MVLPKIIYPIQSVFEPNRDIHDNILSLMRLSFFEKKTKKTKGSYMETASDRLDWVFIKKFLLT